MTKRAPELDQAHDKIMDVKREIRKAIIGMDEAIESLFICFFAGPGRNCHLLFEGVPGTAKTLLLTTLGKATSVTVRRISFAADLLPKDVVGIEKLLESVDEETKKLIYHVQLCVKGPIFAHIVVADEFNRARTISKASMLEPMEEGTLTTEYGGKYFVPSPFMVLATQNPVESEGTFELGRAELDRFLMKVLVGYPSIDDEIDIIRLYTSEPSERIDIAPVIKAQDVLDIRRAIVRHVHVDKKIVVLAQRIVAETRPEASRLDSVKQAISIGGGASPRAGIHLIRAARVYALLHDCDSVTPEDLSAVALRILRHRLAFKTGEDKGEKNIAKIVDEVCDIALSDNGVA